jgi:hypothetical protein
VTGVELDRAVLRLSAFLGEQPLTAAIAEMEAGLEGATASGAADLAGRAGVDSELLSAALVVRRSFGRISDLIHAAAIVVLLPQILDDGETIVRRPSLAAGNDPSRPYDLETNRRVAEFKLSEWKGADAMRMRQTFKDLVYLAADESGRQPELFVVGTKPASFLRSSTSTASWALDRSPPGRRLFEKRFGSLDMSVADFTAGPGARVRITELGGLLPSLGTDIVAAPPEGD